ncbi:MAG: MoxR family ATPase [Gammaproteobacteria bacterium]|nr:MoxR family ATPase [Gammaproteobacteria bacterium]MBL6999406.1 MoxR family ATPase [Gammaproteobacteria bacterium]
MTPVNSLKNLQQQLESVIVGQKALLERLIIAILAGGHVLLEGPPGLAKTTAVHALAAGINADYHRIQFTPDLMPSDLTGSEIYQAADARFVFNPGPIFNQIVLADELNRAPPKVQSALLEAMAEQQVTVGNHTHRLNNFFVVLATQNPLEQFGTYPLPEALLDRFLFKCLLDYPEQAEEIEIARRARQDDKGHLEAGVVAQMQPADVMAMRQQVNKVFVEPSVEAYAVRLVSATRKLAAHHDAWGELVRTGASPRGSIALLRAAMARAYFQQRDYVIPEDVIALAPDILRHRIMLDFSAQAEGVSADAIIQHLLKVVEAP